LKIQLAFVRSQAGYAFDKLLLMLDRQPDIRKGALFKNFPDFYGSQRSDLVTGRQMQNFGRIE
jgi:hypothetical protein